MADVTKETEHMASDNEKRHQDEASRMSNDQLIATTARLHNVITVSHRPGAQQPTTEEVGQDYACRKELTQRGINPNEAVIQWEKDHGYPYHDRDGHRIG